MRRFCASPTPRLNISYACILRVETWCTAGIPPNFPSCGGLCQWNFFVFLTWRCDKYQQESNWVYQCVRDTNCGLRFYWIFTFLTLYEAKWPITRSQITFTQMLFFLSYTITRFWHFCEDADESMFNLPWEIRNSVVINLSKRTLRHWIILCKYSKYEKRQEVSAILFVWN